MEFLNFRSLIKKIPLLFLALLVLSSSWTSDGYPQTGSTSKEEQLPLNITADRLEAEQNQQIITFINNVVARYKDMILYADILKIFYQAKQETVGAKDKSGSKDSPAKQEPSGVKDKSGSNASPKGPESPLGGVGIEKIIRIEAIGKVRIIQEDRVATGDKAIYYTQEDKIVLLGNPQLWRGDNSLKGQEIVLYLKENRAVVESDPKKRVEAVIYPSSKPQLPGKSSDSATEGKSSRKVPQ
jgi:lipopolysaccharide export system protein LptA